MKNISITQVLIGVAVGYGIYHFTNKNRTSAFSSACGCGA